MKFKKRELIISSFLTIFMVILYFQLLVPGNIKKISAVILPYPGCPKGIVHEVYGKPDSTGKTVLQEFIPYILKEESFTLKPLNDGTSVSLKTILSEGKVLYSYLDFYYPSINMSSDKSWYEKRRDQVKFSKLYEEVVAINFPDLEKKLGRVQKESFIKPELQGDLEIPKYAKNPRRYTHPKRIDIFLERSGKVFIESVEVNMKELIGGLEGFKNRAGSSGFIYLYPDHVLKFDNKIIQAAKDLGLRILLIAQYGNKRAFSSCYLYDFEGPPPPVQAGNIPKPQSQNWTVRRSKFHFNEKEYTLKEAQQFLANSFEEIPLRLKIKVAKGTTWQQLMNFYEILPEDIFITLE